MKNWLQHHLCKVADFFLDDQQDGDGGRLWFCRPQTDDQRNALPQLIAAYVAKQRSAALLREKVQLLPVSTYFKILPSTVAHRVLKSMMVSLTNPQHLRNAFKWDSVGVKHAHSAVSTTLCHVAHLHLSHFETARDIKAATQNLIAKKRYADFAGSMIKPQYHGGHKTTVAKVKELGFDFRQGNRVRRC